MNRVLRDVVKAGQSKDRPPWWGETLLPARRARHDRHREVETVHLVRKTQGRLVESAELIAILQEVRPRARAESADICGEGGDPAAGPAARSCTRAMRRWARWAAIGTVNPRRGGIGSAGPGMEAVRRAGCSTGTFANRWSSIAKSWRAWMRPLKRSTTAIARWPAWAAVWTSCTAARRRWNNRCSNWKASCARHTEPLVRLAAGMGAQAGAERSSIPAERGRFAWRLSTPHRHARRQLSRLAARDAHRVHGRDGEERDRHPAEDVGGPGAHPAGVRAVDSFGTADAIRQRAEITARPSEQIASEWPSALKRRAAPGFDYGPVAERFRGTEEYVKSGQRLYLPHFGEDATCLISDAGGASFSDC